MIGRCLLACLGPALALAAPLRGQEPSLPADTVPPDAALQRHLPAILGAAPELLLLGGPDEDRLRVLQLLGAREGDGWLVRAPSSVRPLRTREELRWESIAPRGDLYYNSGIPWSFNDGALWAGRGVSAQLTAGIRATAGRVSVTLAPQLGVEENADFEIIPYSNEGVPRSPFASPWHTTPESLDTPTRFGDRTRVFLSPGQSALTVHAGPLAVGAATENLWWGPGVRNGIVMSSHAAGVPHAFLRTSAPARTPLGDVEGRLILGWLTESEYFDSDPGNDHRSLSAVALTLRPRFDRNLWLGFSRAVYAPVDERTEIAGHALDFLIPIGRPNARPGYDFRRPARPDQVWSLFGRYLLPDDGLEAYFEYARTEFPKGIRDALLHPNLTQGYTLGIQWARPVGAGTVLRLQGEVTNLEQNASASQHRYVGFYKSRPVEQGYTQRGQVLGAAIGHGSSSQWVAGDVYRGRWSLGAFAGRIRWEADTYYRAVYPTEFGYDVSVFAGARGGYLFPWARVEMEASTGSRYNHLFRFNYDPDDFHGIDKRNHTLRVSVTPVAF